MYQNEQPPLMTYRNTMNLGTIVVRALAVTVEVFLHVRIGARYIGLQALVAIPGIVIFSMFWHGHDVRPLWNFLVVFMLMAFAHRLDAFRRQNLGSVEHSRYSGYPWLLAKSKAHLEGPMKQVLEPVLTAVGGVWVTEWNQPLGMYLVVAAIGLFLSNSMNKAWETVQSMDLQDAICDQRQNANRFGQSRVRR